MGGGEESYVLENPGRRGLYTLEIQMGGGSKKFGIQVGGVIKKCCHPWGDVDFF